MTDRLCIHCRRWPATRLAVPYSGERYFCSAGCAVRWAVLELDANPAMAGLQPAAGGCLATSPAAGLVSSVNGREVIADLKMSR